MKVENKNKPSSNKICPNSNTDKKNHQHFNIIKHPHEEKGD